MTRPDANVRWKSVSGVGQRWAPWVLLVSGVVWVPYYYFMVCDFTALGATGAGTAAGMIAIYAIPAVVGALLMLVARRSNDLP